MHVEAGDPVTTGISLGTPLKPCAAAAGEIAGERLPWDQLVDELVPQPFGDIVLPKPYSGFFPFTPLDSICVAVYAILFHGTAYRQLVRIDATRRFFSE